MALNMNSIFQIGLIIFAVMFVMKMMEGKKCEGFGKQKQVRITNEMVTSDARRRREVKKTVTSDARRRREVKRKVKKKKIKSGRRLGQRRRRRRRISAWLVAMLKKIGVYI